MLCMCNMDFLFFLHVCRCECVMIFNELNLFSCSEKDNAYWHTHMHAHIDTDMRHGSVWLKCRNVDFHIVCTTQYTLKCSNNNILGKNSVFRPAQKAKVFFSHHLVSKSLSCFSNHFVFCWLLLNRSKVSTSMWICILYSSISFPYHFLLVFSIISIIFAHQWCIAKVFWPTDTHLVQQPGVITGTNILNRNSPSFDIIRCRFIYAWRCGKGWSMADNHWLYGFFLLRCNT